ncbi:MAG TPA: PEP-CTERM sorting domain-containing protein [Burkholderiales bacterium]|nr:PEP-CTERM sorting domain-containing protein [Burkholderiales bacterium]
MKAWLVAAVLALSVPAANAQTYVSTDVPKNISAGGAVTVTSTLWVPGPLFIDSLTVQLRVIHGWNSDLDLFLVGPTGISVELSTDNGGASDNYFNTVFDDTAATAITSGTGPFAGTYRPEQPLATFQNTSATGLWTLRISDDLLGFGGTLEDWRLTFMAIAIPEPDTYALLLAGLGLLGFAARRRKTFGG